MYKRQNIDSVIILQHVARMNLIEDPNVLDLADVNFDGNVDMQDSIMILRHVAKIESLFDFEPEINEEFNLMSESYLSTDLSVVNIIQNFLGMCKTSDNS